MSDSVKVCPACHTVNQDGFHFCKNCGTPLAGPAVPPPPPTPAPGYHVDEIEGVPIQHVSAFVGNKKKILDKFTQIQITSGKSTWCWPVFVLGFFFGLVGASCWFFYRKIYKPAVALLVSGLLVSGLSATMGVIYGGPIMRNLGSVTKAAEQFAGNEITYDQYMSQATSALFTKEYFILIMFSMVIWLIQLVAVILIAMYAFNFYKKSAIGQIKSFALKFDREIYPYELQAIGGTSPVAVVLVAVGYFILEIVIEFAMMIPFYSSFLK